MTYYENQFPKSSSVLVPMAVLILLFFMWGFITCMNDILIPHLKELFELSYFQAMLVQFAFFGAYFIGSVLYFIISSAYGDPINKIGYKGGIIFGLLISATGCFLFYPAEVYGEYYMFLVALFTLGIGFTLLQISANPYVSVIGDPKGASSRLNLAQGFNSLGTTLAPVIGGYLIFEFFSKNGEITADSTKIPYLIFGGIFILVSVVILGIKLPNLNLESGIQKSRFGALSFPQLRYGVFAIFFYVGAEVAMGSLIINYLALPEVLGVNESIGKNYLALYWGGSMIGRFLGAISLNNNIEKKTKYLYMLLTSLIIFGLLLALVDLSIKQIFPFLIIVILNVLAFVFGKSKATNVLVIFAAINIILLLLSVFGTLSFSFWFLISIGLFNSIMWSNIFTLSINGLGQYTSQGSSLLVMGILGGAIIPLLQGYLADTLGLKLSLLLPIICYLYILWYGYFINNYFSNLKG